MATFHSPSKFTPLFQSLSTSTSHPFLFFLQTSQKIKKRKLDCHYNHRKQLSSSSSSSSSSITVIIINQYINYHLHPSQCDYFISSIDPNTRSPTRQTPPKNDYSSTLNTWKQSPRPKGREHCPHGRQFHYIPRRNRKYCQNVYKHARAPRLLTSSTERVTLSDRAGRHPSPHGRVNKSPPGVSVLWPKRK